MSDTLEGLARCNTIDDGDAPDGSEGGYDKHGNHIIGAAMVEIVMLRAEVERLRGEARAQQPDPVEMARSLERAFVMGREYEHEDGLVEATRILDRLHNLQDDVYKLAARAQQDDARGWRPIAEAPRDGWVLGYYAGDYDVVEWDAEENCWRNASCEALYMTHWMPLPAAPREQSGEEKGDG